MRFDALVFRRRCPRLLRRCTLTRGGSGRAPGLCVHDGVAFTPWGWGEGASGGRASGGGGAGEPIGGGLRQEPRRPCATPWCSAQVRGAGSLRLRERLACIAILDGAHRRVCARFRAAAPPGRVETARVGRRSERGCPRAGTPVGPVTGVETLRRAASASARTSVALACSASRIIARARAAGPRCAAAPRRHRARKAQLPPGRGAPSRRGRGHGLALLPAELPNSDLSFAAHVRPIARAAAASTVGHARPRAAGGFRRLRISVGSPSRRPTRAREPPGLTVRGRIAIEPPPKRAVIQWR